MSQFVEVERKANAGERIKIVNAWMSGGFYTSGDVLIATDRGISGIYVHINGEERFIADHEYVVLEPVATQSFFSTPIFEKFTQFLRDNADEVRKIIAEESQAEPVEVAPNNVLTRAKVIAQAKADVAELERIGESTSARLPLSSPFSNQYYIVKFYVNRSKRAVTALVYRKYGSSEVQAKNTAKCVPGEVFNADIGKAIALRRALGLTVPSEYLNAPQPDEPRVGADIRWDSGVDRSYRVTKIDTQFYDFYNYDTKEYVNNVPYGGGIADYCTIIDDTDVDYTDGTEVAA